MTAELQPARTSIHSIAAEIIRTAPPTEAAEIAWSLACGAAVADRTRVLGVEDGVLRVAAEDDKWRAQLAEFAPRYLAAISKLWPQGKIRRIELLDERRASQSP
jgi:hypothetical protein